jgi:hypothetical protein
MAIALDVFGIIEIIVAALLWRITGQAHGRALLRSAWAMAKIMIGTIKRPLLAGSIIGLLTPLGRVLVPDWVPPIPALTAIGAAALVLSYLCLPPAVLLLGSSDPHNLVLYNKLIRATIPMRLVHLLDDFRFGRWGISISETSVRALPQKDWYAVVEKLMTAVPLIVLDMRSVSGPVIWEAKTILASPTLTSKTLFITASAGQRLIFDMLTSPHTPFSRELTIVQPDHAAGLVKAATRKLYST